MILLTNPISTTSYDSPVSRGRAQTTRLAIRLRVQSQYSNRQERCATILLPTVRAIPGSHTLTPWLTRAPDPGVPSGDNHMCQHVGHSQLSSDWSRSNHAAPHFISPLGSVQRLRRRMGSPVCPRRLWKITFRSRWGVEDG